MQLLMSYIILELWPARLLLQCAGLRREASCMWICDHEMFVFWADWPRWVAHLAHI